MDILNWEYLFCTVLGSGGHRKQHMSWLGQASLSWGPSDRHLNVGEKSSVNDLDELCSSLEGAGCKNPQTP